MNRPVVALFAVSKADVQVDPAGLFSFPCQVHDAAARGCRGAEVARTHPLAQETKRIEDRALTRRIGADEHVEIAELDGFFAQASIALYADIQQLHVSHRPVRNLAADEYLRALRGVNPR